MQSTRVLEIEGIGPVTFVKRVSSKGIKLSIEANGTVRVSLPKRSSFLIARAFVESKKSWIILKRNTLPKEVLFLQGARVGKAHTLQYFRSVNANHPTVKLKQNIICVIYPVVMDVYSEAVQAKAKKGVEKALKVEAENLLPVRLRTLADKYSFTYASVTFKKLKTRWGSCSSKKEITLNYYLMNLPWYMIDYVLLHELTHTKFMHHQKPFWDHMLSILPTTKEIRSELKLQKNF